jgi:hypothetical protein
MRPVRQMRSVARKPAAAMWMAGAFSAALFAAAVALLMLGINRHGVVAAVKSSARAAFVFFWLAYAGGGLSTLFGPYFAGLARRRREFGLAFAAALSVHLTLVAVLFRVSLRPPIGDAGIVYFGIGALWTYALALLSIERVRRLLRPSVWQFVRSAGMEYITLLFVLDFVIHPIRNGFNSTIAYAPFAALVIIGPLLRWAGLVQGWRRRLAASSGTGLGRISPKEY